MLFTETEIDSNEQTDIYESASHAIKLNNVTALTITNGSWNLAKTTQLNLMQRL